MKVAILTIGDPKNVLSYSGTNFYICQALEKNGVELVYNSTQLTGWLGKTFVRLCELLTRRSSRFYFHKFWLFSFFYAREARAFIEREKPDLVLCLLTYVSAMRLKIKMPLVYYGDHTHFLMTTKYDKKYSLRNFYHRFLDRAERQALRNTDVCIWTSKWAKDGGSERGLKTKPNYIIPFGANLRKEPTRETVLQAIETRLDDSVCRLFFLGVNWKWKGGMIAYNAFRYLKEMGVDVELVVCGCVMPKECMEDGITNIPFLRKNIDEEYQQLETLFLKSHFFVLPTRKEAFGIVYGEAAAYGLPSMGTKVGGVPIVDGVNGYAFDLKATGADYANEIANIFSDKEKYKELCNFSRGYFEEELNWNVWAGKFIPVLEETMASSSATSY